MHSFLTLDQLPPTHRVWVDAALTAVKANPEPNSIEASPDGVTVYRVYTDQPHGDRIRLDGPYVQFWPARHIRMTATRPNEPAVKVSVEGGWPGGYRIPKTWLGRPVVFAEGVA